MYDLAQLNQAWYIACDECIENIPEDMGSEPAFRHILAYCERFALGLLRDAAKETNERRDAELRPSSDLQ
jgi:hypothetical protein